MPLMAVPVPKPVERTVLVVSIGLLATASWLALWLGGSSLHAWAHHHGMGHHQGPSSLLPLLFIGGWTVMTLAMMLPTTLPILTTFQAIAGERQDRNLLLGLVILGYILTWAIFGGLLYFGHQLAKGIVSGSPWLQPHLWAAAPAILLLAGVFQFTPLKYRCLEKCRSPLSFVIGHWQGRDHRSQAFRLGIDHGIFCVGCCWALMLLMLAAGLDSLGWMLILALIMAIEKNVSWGRRISAPVGILLIGLSVVLFVNGPAWRLM